MVLAVGLAVAAVVAFAAVGAGSGSKAQRPRGVAVVRPTGLSPQVARNQGEDEGPPATAEELASAICSEIVSQARPEARTRLGKLLLGPLSRRVEEGVVQVALPCDGPGLISFGRLSEMYLALAEAYGVPLGVGRVRVGKYTFGVATIGVARPAGGEAEWLSSISGERFGGLLDLIFQSVVMAAVGTVTSMGVSGAVRAAGGEPRLARLLRHHKKAEAAGNQKRARKIQDKILRSASRIKGRQVDWSEVERLAKGSGTPSVA